MYNYSKNKIVGGRNNSKRNLSIKLKQNNNKYNLNKTIKSKINKKMEKNIQETFNQITFPEVEQYLFKNKFRQGYLHYTVCLIRYMKENHENRQKLIKYIMFKNSIEYTKEFVSKIIFENCMDLTSRFRMVHNFPTQLKEYAEYYSKLNNITDILIFYKHYTYSEVTDKLIEYYDIHDKPLANNIRALNCLFWVIKAYYDMEEDHTFNNYNKTRLKELMTPKLQKMYDEQTSYTFNFREGKTENDKVDYLDMTIKEYIEDERLGQLIRIIKNIAESDDKTNPEVQEMNELYEQICFTGSWDFTDYSRIISYIIKYDLDVYDTLITLGGDYNYAMYVAKPVRPGVQSTASSIIAQSGYKVDVDKERTPEVQKMLDELYEMNDMGYIYQYEKSFDELMGLFKKTFEKHLIWGLEIV